MTLRLFYFTILLVGTFNLLAQNTVEVSSIHIAGNKRTKAFVIKKELLLTEGESYPVDSLDYLLSVSENRVMNTNLFNAVSIVYAEVDQKINLLVQVTEKWYDWPIPFVEFSDRNFNVWSNFSFDPDRTNYGIYLFNYNLWGRNHTLKTSFIQGYNPAYGLEYRVPFFSPESNFGMRAKAKYSSQSELWLETLNDELQFYKDGNPKLIEKIESELTLTNRFNPFTTAEASLITEQTNLGSSILPDAEAYLLNGDSSMLVNELRLSIKHDTRDNIYFPLEGFYLNPSVSIQRFSNSDPFTNIYTSYSLQQFGKLKPEKWYYAVSIFGEINSDSFLPYEYSRRLGYDQLVRGYENYVVEGNNSFLFHSEIKYALLNKPQLPVSFVPLRNYKILPTKIFITYFFDAGTVLNKVPIRENELPNTLLLSTGLSFQMLLYNDRVFRIDYSLNKNLESGFFVHFTKPI